MENRQLKTAQDALTFIQGGNARFTLRSKKTKTHYTYRVRPSKDGEIFFVSLLTGPDNDLHFSYIGIIARGNFRWTTKSRVSEESDGFLAFKWTWLHLGDNHLPDSLEIWHEGKCCRCGRTLTVPESLARGIGPECAKYFPAQLEMTYENTQRETA